MDGGASRLASMRTGKLVSAALFLDVGGALLILPPLARLFKLEQRCPAACRRR